MYRYYIFVQVYFYRQLLVRFLVQSHFWIIIGLKLKTRQKQDVIILWMERAIQLSSEEVSQNCNFKSNLRPLSLCFFHRVTWSHTEVELVKEVPFFLVVHHENKELGEQNAHCLKNKYNQSWQKEDINDKESTKAFTLTGVKTKII